MINKLLHTTYKIIPILLLMAVMLIVVCIFLGYSILGEIPTYGKLDSDSFKYVKFRNVSFLFSLISIPAVVYWPFVSFFYVQPNRNKIPRRKFYFFLYIISITAYLVLILFFKSSMDWYLD